MEEKQLNMPRIMLLSITLTTVLISSCFILYVLLFLEGQLNEEFEVSKLTFKNGNDYLVLEQLGKVYKKYLTAALLCLILNSGLGILLIAKREKKIGLFVLLPSLAILLAILALVGLSRLVWDGFM